MAAGNDVSILTGIMAVLLVLSIVMPFVYEATGYTGDSPEIQIPDELYGNQTAIEEFTSISSTNWFPVRVGILSSIFYAFFWVYPWFPIWLTTLHILIRVIGIVLVYRLVRSGGG